VFKAHRRWYHSTLGLTVTKNKKTFAVWVQGLRFRGWLPAFSGVRFPRARICPTCTLRVVHLGRSTCHAISGRGVQSTREHAPSPVGFKASSSPVLLSSLELSDTQSL